MSTFSWMDYSERQRRQALDVIDQFKEQDTRDELGVGTVRDAFADLLFPGTSTIQTRARYFFFIPWVYQALEVAGARANEVADRARRAEGDLIQVLRMSDDTDGVIGKEAGYKLKRMPSDIYWQGLRRWGTCKVRSRDQYYRSFGRSNTAFIYNDDGEPADGELRLAWHSKLPKAPGGFPAGATFRMTAEEAEFLVERLQQVTPPSMLACLADAISPFTKVDFPWEHPYVPLLPRRITDQLDHARNFSDAIKGAPLLYNLMLAELIEDSHLVENYRLRLQNWLMELRERKEDLAGWNRAAFWRTVSEANNSVPFPTQSFINTWLDLVNQALSPEGSHAVTGPTARRLIHQRERALKRGLARLDSPAARDRWNRDSGTARLNYRWPTAQRFLLDILDGLNGGGEGA